MINIIQNCKYLILLFSFSVVFTLNAKENATKEDVESNSTISTSSNSDSIVVTGKILGNQGKPLENVQISIEGVRNSVITNTAGEFSIKSPSGDVWLLLYPVGDYHSKRVFLNNRKNVKIYVTPKDLPTNYDEVKTQNGKTVKRNVIASFNEIDAESFFEEPYTVTDQFFQGVVPGMYVTSSSSTPGEGAFEILRGIKSMNGNVQPLYIVDGVLLEKSGLVSSPISGHNFNPLVSIDPQDISKITVLKDASATALYGMKGSNGVVLIETLTPSEVKTTIDLKVRGGISFQPKEIPLLNASQHKSLSHEVLVSGGFGEEFYKEVLPGLFDDRYGEDYLKYANETNWQDQVFRNTTVQDIAMTIKGGDAIARYGLSVGYLNHKGIVQNTDFSRFNIRFVGTFNIVEWLRMYISTAINYNSSNLMDNGLNVQTSPIYSALFKAPSMHPFQFNENGEELTYLDEVGPYGISNPRAVVDNYRALSENNRLMSSVRLEADLTKSFKFESIISVNLNKLREEIFWPNKGMSSYLDGEAINVVMQQTDGLYSTYNDNKLTYHKSLGLHRLAATGGLRLNLNTFEEDRGFTTNAPSNDEYRSLGNGTKLQEITGINNNWNWMSVYANIEYSYRDKYFVGGIITADGSSRIGKNADTPLQLFDTPFGLFNAISGAWRLSNEPGIRDVGFIEDLKLRASYGVTGNDDIGAFNSRAYYSPVRFETATGAILGSIPNEELKHEEVTKSNVGLDLSLFGDRVIVTADYFDYKTTDMLILERQSSYLGYPFNPTNGGGMQNTGFEASFMARLVQAGKFNWDIGANISTYKNQITQITGGSLITDIPGAQIISKVGEPVNSFYGYVADGVFPSTEATRSAQLVNSKGKRYSAGDVKYRDLNNDGIINNNDKTILGSANPDWFGGAYTSFSYGAWSLDAMFTYSLGGELYNYMRYQTEKMTDLSNQSAATLSRWQHEGQVTNVPRALFDDPIGNTAFSSRFIEDGSYMRLRNLTLSYTVNNEVKIFGLDAATVRNAKIFITGTNLFTISNYLGYDPEFSYSTDPLLQGIDYGQSPQSKSIIIGIKLGL